MNQCSAPSTSLGTTQALGTNMRHTLQASCTSQIRLPIHLSAERDPLALGRTSMEHVSDSARRPPSMIQSVAARPLKEPALHCLSCCRTPLALRWRSRARRARFVRDLSFNLMHLLCSHCCNCEFNATRARSERSPQFALCLRTSRAHH
jgi:hypothetical protein